MSNVTGARAMQETFRQAAGTYELVNHVLTFGLDMIWRRRAARFAASGGGARWMDICSGTGEMAVHLRRLAPPDVQVVAVDLTAAMLAQAAAKPEASDIGFAVANVRALPFADATFDLLTISFATRNVNISREILLEVFREAHRVLKPGGRFVNLETSQPPNPVIRWLFHTYIRLFVRPVGQLISGSRAAYAYLSHTIPRFYTAAELAAIFREAGFAELAVAPMMFGAAAIHVAHKSPN
jgi:demethylmenaquinone methyltransferase/2-methoxy-6-polyprenyl-1,4-benzoquinol methylase